MVLLAAGALGYLVLLPEDRTMPGYSEIERSNSNFGTLQVVKADGEPYYFLLNDLLRQNGYDPRAPSERAQLYLHAESALARLHAANLERPVHRHGRRNRADAVCPRGESPRMLSRSIPPWSPIAERYFDFNPKDINLTIDDGRHFLNRILRQYDTIILDAFVGDSSPSHLMTREAFSAMRAAPASQRHAGHQLLRRPSAGERLLQRIALQDT